jgi:serine/threonine-protein kinase HipA
MRVGVEQADSTLANAMSMCTSFGLKTDQAAREIRFVIATIDRWKKHFRSCGVSARDIESLAEQSDRPFLEEQRRDF